MNKQKMVEEENNQNRSDEQKILREIASLYVSRITSRIKGHTCPKIDDKARGKGTGRG